MRKCIGCKCCVVACNEQNGNPASINWRRVGEIEGGWFPQRHALVPVDGLQPLPRAHVPRRAARSTPTPRTPRPASCATAPTPASAASTAPGTVPTACRSTTPSAAWWASATCATAACRPAPAPACVSACPEGAIQIEIVERWRSGAPPSASPAPRGRARPRTAACPRRASRWRATCRPTRARATSPTSGRSTRTGRSW